MKAYNRLGLMVFFSVALTLFLVSGVSAALCRHSDGYMRGCSGTDLTNQKSYSSGSYQQSTYPGYNSRTFSQGYNYNTNYQHSYHVSPPRTNSYTVTYDMHYKNEYNQGYYGYDKFTYTSNGYEREYNYGTYGYQKTDYLSRYEVRRTY